LPVIAHFQVYDTSNTAGKSTTNFWLLLLVDSYQLKLIIAEKVQHNRANEKYITRDA
jgi:predicted ATPase